MALTMTRPWKHPKTGVYWLRKRVPDALQTLVGKREEKCSLGTKDPVKAKTRLLEALSELEVRWSNLRQGPRTLTEQEAHELARPIHDNFLRLHQSNPSQQRIWNTEIGVAGVWEMPPEIPEAHLLVQYDLASIRQERCFASADELLERAGLTVDEPSRLKLAKAVSAALQRASLTLERYAQGELESIGAAPPAGLIGGNSRFRPAAQPVSLEGLADEWAAEKRPAQKPLLGPTNEVIE